MEDNKGSTDFSIWVMASTGVVGHIKAKEIIKLYYELKDEVREMENKKKEHKA